MSRRNTPRIHSKKLRHSHHRMSLPHKRWPSELPSEFQESIDRFIALQRAQIAIGGTFAIPSEPLTLFFQTLEGKTHCLNFSDDQYSEETYGRRPPSFDALLFACQPSSVSVFDTTDFPEYPSSLIFPSSLPFALSLDLSNHPILDIIRAVLFPLAQAGQYLVAMRSHLEVHPPSCHSPPQRDRYRQSKVATLMICLPVTYHGGALVVHSPNGIDREAFAMNGTSNGDLEWTAFLPDCEYEIQTVEDGFRVTMFYDILMKSFGPCGVGDIPPNPLITPSEYYLETLSQILNGSKGRWIGFYLSGDYTTSPSDVLADSLVPTLKGPDSMLYHALKLYYLAPELRYTAGGYIWPVDRTVQIRRPSEPCRSNYSSSQSSSHYSGSRAVFSDSSDDTPYSSDEEIDSDDCLEVQVRDSGAVPLVVTGIQMLTSPVPGPRTKQKVAFIAKGRRPFLDVLYINICMILFVP